MILSRIRSLTRMALPAIRRFATEPVKTQDGQNERYLTFADNMELITGYEKQVELMYELGIKDIWYSEACIRNPGTKDLPVIVLTWEPKRLVSCLCDEDDCHFMHMWVHIGDEKRCECGYWFRAVKAPPMFEPVEGRN